METIVLTSTTDSIQQAADLLIHGELVAFPTETVYGVGARIFDETAVQKIFTVKGRPADNPLIAHISSLAQVDRIATNVPDIFYRLAHAFFPGPLTLVVARNRMVPDIVSASAPTIAIRMPHHEIALALINSTGEPLVAPSANLSGKPSPTTAQDVLEDLHGKIAAVIDGGPCKVGIESTVLDLTTPTPVILRPGAITKEQIERFLKQPILENFHSDTEAPKAPGMKYRHYAPQTHIMLVDSWAEVQTHIQHSPSKTYVLLSVETPPIPVKKHEKLSATTLFQIFRSADRERYDEIIILLDEKTKQNAGLMNRIEKAAHEESI